MVNGQARGFWKRHPFKNYFRKLVKYSLSSLLIVKHAISFAIIFAILLQSLGSLVVITAFEMNHDYIAKNLCINKNKPQMHCNGKCDMHKMLQKEESQNNSPVAPVKEKTEVLQFFQSSELSFVNPVVELSSTINIYTENKITGFTSAVFHPPSLQYFS